MKTSNNWEDIHIAYQVAKLGTLSAAALHLGVHHSTVLRHVDALESRLKCKLFHRHARGYNVTEAGKLLFQEAQQTQERFDRMLGKLAGQDDQLSGTLVITTVSTMSPVLMPIIARFNQMHPNIQVELASDSRIFKLEYGEAHVSVRPGAKPKDPDYVVQLLQKNQSTLYASRRYIDQYGGLKSLAHTQGHKFIGSISALNNIPMMKWLNQTVDKSMINFRGTDFNSMMDAAVHGLGIVCVGCLFAKTKVGLQPLLAPPKEWDNDLWLVTHRDIHRSPKVQAFTQLLKSMMSERP
jgi:DNA-binding transcriptional LysR family regulator